MRRPPDLVFLNCCHLASVDSEIVRRTGDGTPSAGPPAGELLNQRLKRPQLAASLSRTLMAMGVRAVVAAGWAVDDRAASEFAKAFYDRMLDGESFGPAVRSARIAAHQSDGGASNTWAAYQCYGDPGFRISTSTRRYTTPSIPVSADELVRAVEALAVKAGDAGIEIETVREELRRFERIAQENWGEHGDIRAALGQASSACGDLADAVRQYRKALAAAAGDVPISVIEQLANLEMRLAAEVGDGEVTIDDEVWPRDPADRIGAWSRRDHLCPAGNRRATGDQRQRVEGGRRPHGRPRAPGRPEDGGAQLLPGVGRRTASPTARTTRCSWTAPAGC